MELEETKKDKEEKEKDDPLLSYETRLKGSAYHAVNAILLRNAIREEHTNWSNKLPPETAPTLPDPSGVTLVAKPLPQGARIDKRPLHTLFGIIDHPKSKTQITVTIG